MKTIPKTLYSPVLRTNFSDNTVWNSICTALQQPVEELIPNVDFINDLAYDGLTQDQLLALLPPDMPHTFIFIVDDVTISNPEHPILIMDLFDEPGRTFRIIPAVVYIVECNLSLANLDFADFANSTDEDGVYRKL